MEKVSVHMTIKVTVANSGDQNIHEFLDQQTTIAKGEMIQRTSRAYSYVRLFDVHAPDHNLGGDWWVNFELTDPTPERVQSSITAARDHILAIIEDAKRCALRTTLSVI